jgi:hypothetical protein
VREKFIHKHPDSPVPIKPFVSKLTRKWRNAELVLEKSHRKKAVLTDEKFEDIQNRLQSSPQKPLRRLTQEIGMSAGVASDATKLITFLLYKVRFVHELKPIDAPQRMQSLFITIEVYFYLSD